MAFHRARDHRTTEYLKELDEKGTLSDYKWAHPWPKNPDNHFEVLNVDETGLKTLLEFVGSEEGSEGTLKYGYDETYDMSVSRAGAVCMALDFALRIGRHEDVVQKLMSIITEDVGYLHHITKSRGAWALLKVGYLAEKWNDGEDVSSEFERLKYALTKRTENGVLRPLKDVAMNELVDRLNENTIKHDEDEDQDIIELEQLQQHVFMGNRSILHHPASASEIEALEQKLGLQLPEDYKEFLRVSNGLEGIWNGYFRQRHLGSTKMVKPSERIWGDYPIPLELVDWTELPFKVDWPSLDLEKAIAVYDPADEGQTWLVKQELTKQAVERFFQIYDGLALDDTRRTVVGNIIKSYFGSLDDFRAMEWCVLTWTHWGIVLHAWKSFREFMETLALESKR